MSYPNRGYHIQGRRRLCITAKFVGQCLRWVIFPRFANDMAKVKVTLFYDVSGSRLAPGRVGQSRQESLGSLALGQPTSNDHS
jgi:hypothetical protein